MATYSAEAPIKQRNQDLKRCSCHDEHVLCFEQSWREGNVG
jgi:hypothetical protein